MTKLKEIEKFDGAFFGIMSRIGDIVDPQTRIVLESNLFYLFNRKTDSILKELILNQFVELKMVFTSAIHQ
jgi:hypothetical protein